MKFFMHQNNPWWELFDSKGQLIKMCLISEYDLNDAITYFTDYCTSFCDSPVICEYEELFKQG